MPELEADAGEDQLAAEIAAKATVRAFERKRPSRKPFPEHLPRERVVITAPASCPCCGSSKLSKLGEDITETLEVIPRQWKVSQAVREKFTCRASEKDHPATEGNPSEKGSASFHSTTGRVATSQPLIEQQISCNNVVLTKTIVGLPAYKHSTSSHRLNHILWADFYKMENCSVRTS